MLFRKEALKAKQVKLYGNVLLTTPVPLKVISTFLLLLVLSVALFLSVASFPRVERVPGAVVPSKGIVNVRSSSNGVLSQLSVVQGQEVERGEIVGRISFESTSMGINTRESERIKWIDNKIENIEVRKTLRDVYHTRKVEGIALQQAHLEERLTRLSSMRDLQSDIVEESIEANERAMQATDLRLVALDRVTSVKTRMLNDRKTLQQLDSEIASISEQIESLNLEKSNLEAENDLNMATLEAEKIELIGEREISTAERSVDVMSPVSGTVSAVLLSLGSAVRGSNVIFSILPEGSELEVELYVPSRAIGFMEEGQDVNLLFDAFPVDQYGTQPGTIKSITDSVIRPADQNLLLSRRSSPSEPVYKVSVALERNSIEAFGRQFSIQPGMLVVANVVLEERTVFSWIFKPLLTVLRRN